MWVLCLTQLQEWSVSKEKKRFGQQRKNFPAFSLDMGDLEGDKGDFNM